MLRVQLLGQFDVRVDDKRVLITSRAGQSLMAYLMLSVGTAHRREKLAGLLWPETSDENARRNLRQELWRLRKALTASQASAAEYLLADELTIAFNPEASYWLDAAQLERDLSSGASLDERIQQAALYQSELLPGFYDEWIVLERERVQALFERKLQQLLAQLIAEGRWTSTLEWSERWIALGQTPEPAYRALMIAYAELSDPAKVAATYERCVGALDKELGVEPSAETQALHAQLLRGEAVQQVNLSAAQVAPRPGPLHDEPAAPGDPPFKGLQYFDEGDADLFFGRELLTARLIERLRGSHFLAVVVGASGSGKSSVVRAGLIPGLKTGGLLAAGLWPPAGSREWRYEIITPTAHPLEALALALTRPAESVTAAATFMDDLLRDARSLRLFVHRALDADPNTGRLLLVVDQFEELFTLCHDDFEREAFIDNLLTALPTAASEGDPLKAAGGEDEGLITLILTIRADFYAHLAQYPELRDAVARQQEYIGPLTVEELRRAIEEPARRGEWQFEPGLVDLMLRDVGDEPGALPLLSHALLETWTRRSGRTLTLKGYAAAGGVRGAIAFTAETVYQQLSPEQQSLARNVFLRLTELGEGTEDTRRRATLHELMTQPEQAASLLGVLDVLANARLISLGADSAEVAHEAVIREWPRLRAWLNEDREGLQLHRNVTDAAHGWELLERDPGALYRGARLAQAGEWALANPDALNALERAFLDASRESEQREALEREGQQQRELEAARKLAEEQTRGARRLRRRALYLAGAFLVAILMAGAALFFGLRARQTAVAAQAANHIATSRELASASIINLNVDPERSILLALQAEAQADTFQAQDALHQAVQTSRLLKRVPVALGTFSAAWLIAYSPDGTRLATEDRDAQGQWTTQIRDAATLDVLFTKPGIWADDRWLHADRLPIAAPGADGSSAILTVWDATGQRAITTVRLAVHFDDPYPPYIDLSPDLTKVAAVSNFDYGDLSVYDLATGQRLPDPRKPGYANNGMLRFSPDSRSLLTIDAATDTDQNWSLVDVATGRELMTRPLQGSFPSLIDFSPDGKRFAVDENQFVRIVDLASGQVVVTLVGHIGFVESGLQFSADGTRVVTVARDGTARIWDAATGQSLLTVFGHDPLTMSAAFSPDGTRLATLSSTGVQTWAIAPTDTREWLAVPAVVDCNCMVAFSPDGTQLAVFSSFNTVSVLDSHSGRTRLKLPDPGNQRRGLAFSPDGTRLATSGDALGTARVWDLLTGKVLLVLEGHLDRIGRVIFSPDGTRLATIDRSGTAGLWDAASGQQLFSLAAFDEVMQDPNDMGLAFSPDGSRLATAGGASIKIWNTLTGKAVLALPHVADNWAYAVAFSPDGKHLAVSFRGGSASVWEAATGKKLFDLTGHTGSVRHLAYSPDGTRIATASVDGTARLWDATTGIEQFALTGHTGQVTGLAFSPDGARLATTSRDGTVRVYALRVEDLVKIAQSRVTRSLTTAECQKYLHVNVCPALPQSTATH